MVRADRPQGERRRQDAPELRAGSRGDEIGSDDLDGRDRGGLAHAHERARREQGRDARIGGERRQRLRDHNVNSPTSYAHSLRS